MARRDRPQAHPFRRAVEDGGGGRDPRRHRQPGHLREGDPRDRRVRRAARKAHLAGEEAARHLRGGGGYRRARRLRRAAAALRSAAREGRVRLAGSVALHRARYRRVDTAVDKLLEAKRNKDLQGKIAVANAKEAYQVFLRSIGTDRWKKLEAKGATRQRPLWASTGTKNKAYSDVLYVEPLIGRDTVNTMPLGTLEAFNDHGKLAGETVMQGVEEARAQLKKLGEVGIDLEKVCAE